MADMHALVVAAGAAARFRQAATTGDLAALVEKIRADQPVLLVAPVEAPLAWSEARARRWACDCVERLLEACGTEEDEARALYFAIAVGQRYADGAMTRDVLEGARRELDVEEWPSYLTPAFHGAVRAAKLATALETHGGTWAADAAREAADAAAAFAREAKRDAAAARTAERAWQQGRLVELLTR